MQLLGSVDGHHLRNQHRIHANLLFHNFHLSCNGVFNCRRPFDLCGRDDLNFDADIHHVRVLLANDDTKFAGTDYFDPDHD